MTTTQDAIRKLETACELYCKWYDHGEPEWMTGGDMAYELVSFIREVRAMLTETTT